MKEFFAMLALTAMLAFSMTVVAVSVAVIFNALTDDPLDWRAEPGFPHCPDGLIVITTEGYECATYSITEGTK